MVTIKAGPLAELVRDVFVKAGCSAAEAERIGKYLVSANLTGHDSHGVTRVPRYVIWMRERVVHADRKAKVVIETPVLAVVDGLHGFGQTVAPQAVAIDATVTTTNPRMARAMWPLVIECPVEAKRPALWRLS